MVEDTTHPTVMICDDDDVFLSFCSRILKKAGFHVITAANGDDAIEHINTGTPIRLALIDLLMPVRSGWEVIEHMKKNPATREVPIIAITGLAPSPEDLKRVKGKCNAVVHKGADFNLEEFSGLIEELTKGEN
ncbi:response regulator [Lentisphaerota bacterium ZTH]|nr:response regulator [Lentisphaerota bacterium]WET05712.1 response regulator [Lentisphaerota bacterium ZTH]